ncbi:MAG: hypothetical protein JWM96_471 [Alphaproteobacteria bacterium]|nr:hypothetical protein [Alphaproteobacteria bacterium]
MLASCLPGKKKEEAVIAKATQATHTVEAEKLAADLGSAARLLLNDPANITDTNDLKTQSCPDGSVISYIPRNAGITEKGALPPTLSRRMRDVLQASFEPSQIADTTTCVNMQQVAINSPILVLNLAQTSLAAIPENDADVMAVDMAPCGDNRPGVTITRTMKDNSKVVDNTRCGAAPTKANTPDIVLSRVNMPDWKRRLTTTDIAASANFACIVDGQTGLCNPVGATDKGLKLDCTNVTHKDEYLVNPVYDPAIRMFKSNTGTPVPGNCGKGWTGSLVARINQKTCKIKRNGIEENPASVLQVVNVAARCTKQNVRNLPSQCPAGMSGSFYAQYDRADMDAPVLLEPQGQKPDGTTQSLIAMPGFQASSKDVIGIKTVLNASDTYVPSVNLRTIVSDPVNDPQDNAFATTIVRDMGAKAKLYTVNDCNIVGNTCGMGTDRVVIIVDRSASMGSENAADKVAIPSALGTLHSCKAGLKNLFQTAQADQACSAAKTFAGRSSAGYKQDRSLKFTDFIGNPWAGKPPTGSLARLSYQTMEDALINKEKYRPYLQFALATGWDCRGRPDEQISINPNNTANTIEPFPVNMFGTCTGSSSCETCPGECVETTPVAIPSGNQGSRIQAAEFILRKIASMKLLPDTKITLADFLNDRSTVRNIVYCPLSRQVNGGCDEKMERDYLVATLAGPVEPLTSYIKPVEQTVTIPDINAIKSYYSIVPETRTTPSMWSEANSGMRQAPLNQVMTARYHEGDENGWTTHEYATLKAVDQNGVTIPGTVTVEDLITSGPIKESAGIYFKAPAGRVIVGRRHDSDENGDTRYMTGIVKFNGVAATTENPVESPSVNEEKGNGKPYPEKYWTRPPLKNVLTGRIHWGDERGDTRYMSADLRVQAPPGPEVCAAQCLAPNSPSPAAWEDYKDTTATNTRTVIPADVNDYDYDQCVTSTDCALNEKICVESADPAACSSAEMNCSNLMGAPVTYNPPGYSGLRFPDPLPFLTASSSYTTDPSLRQETFCQKRRKKPNAGSNVSNFTACLDTCPSPTVVDTQSVQICRNIPLFGGGTTQRCDTANVPKNISYSPANYTGASTTTDVTRYVPARKTDPEATEITTDPQIPAEGIDYGGYTPLFKTIDLVLSDPDIAADMADSSKRVSFVILTDGVDTGDGSTQVKSLCGAGPDSLLSQITARNGKAVFISLTDTSVINAECLVKFPGATISEVQLQKAPAKILEVMGVDPDHDLSDPVAAKAFCNTNYGAWYEDKKVTSAAAATLGSCRPFEVDQ